MTLQEARENIGEVVIYRDRNAYSINSNMEIGVITAVNTEYVFVKYGIDQHSKATMPGDISLEDP